jgi:hypothetical protein
VDSFRVLVQNMRTAQKRWFKLRDQKALEDAKRLEREVDRELERDMVPSRTPSLFDKIKESSRP